MRTAHVRRCCALIGLAWVLLGLSSMPALALFDLELMIPKTQYLVDEPLFVTVRLTNVGSSWTAIPRLFQPGHGILAFEVTAPSESPHRAQSWVAFTNTPDTLARSAIWLAPEEAYTAVVDLTYEIREARRITLLSEPGEYIIQANFTTPQEWIDGAVTARSDELRLTASQPDGVDRTVLAMLRADSDTGSGGPWAASKEAADRYQRVIREFPDSAYAVYVRFHLAHALHFQSAQALRGTPRGVAALSSAASLYLTVAEDAGTTPLGLYSMKLAARSFAQLGDLANAQALFEQAFCTREATDEDRLEILSALGRLESGGFEGWGVLESGGVSHTPVLVPLRRFADTLQLTLGWDPATKVVVVRGSRLQALFRPGGSLVSVNGRELKGMRTSLCDGRTRVSPSVIASLMAEQRGAGVANALSSLLAQAPQASP